MSASQRSVRYAFLCMILFLSACDPAPPDSGAAADSGAQSAVAVEYRQVEWTELMPEEDLAALLSPPEEIMNIPDGSEMDQISSQMSNAIAQANDSRYQQALTSTKVVADFNNQHISIPGFIVPLDFNDKQMTTRFFLVPYFGACIHVPPPPPNQIILVDYPAGIKVDELYDPFQVSGLLKTSLFQHEMATSSYHLDAKVIEPYVETGGQPTG
ncbi:MAG: hypothetical protein CML06_05395 [Pseudomonadales bacterium]|nr:hypothetical protein [Pseudomonadales bacterium]